MGLITTMNSTFLFQQIPSEPPISTLLNEITTKQSTITTTTVMISQNSTLGSISSIMAAKNYWVPSLLYSYLANGSKKVTLKIVLETNKKDEWHIDDISVRNSSLIELLINGNFESTPPNTGWIINKSTCGNNADFTTGLSYSSSNSYYDKCDGIAVSLSQSFNVTFGQVYAINFWYYFIDNPGGGGNPVQITVIID
ncbi:hypothetical protein I4U23_023028 [Adineta vaga]|nr:hypothetical protein I4U23_023028 [Adineta vaga]